MAINTGKVVTGGLAGGLVLAVLDYVVNGLLFAAQNRAAMDALNPALAGNMERPATIVGFILIDFVMGIVLVWTYAAMRPRFGPGPKTAVLAAVQVWLVAGFMYAAMTLLGLFTWSYFFLGAVAFIVMLIAAALVGGMVYREE